MNEQLAAWREYREEDRPPEGPLAFLVPAVVRGVPAGDWAWMVPPEAE